MARECGWNKDWIDENLTIEQINAYYEKIQKIKHQDEYIRTLATLHAVGSAFGTVTKENMMEFLEILQGKKKNVNAALDKIKDIGIPIEEH